MLKFFRAVGQDLRAYRILYLLLLLLVVFMGVALHGGTRGADGREYLRWTHSLVFDQDLHLLNNAEAVGGGYNLTPTGYVFERVNIGTPLAWLPFYGLARLFLPESADPTPAVSLVQLLWINFSSWLYPILAAIIIFGALRHHFSKRTLAGAIIAVYLGTPVLFYMVTFPASAHPISIFLSSIFLYVWLVGRQKPSYLYYLASGIVIGWLMVVASYNIVFWGLLGFDLLRHLLTSESDPPLSRGGQVLKYGLTTTLGGLIGFAPQLLVWWFVFGNPLYSPYSGQLLWSEPYLLDIWFSSFHGLFVYAPVLFLIIPGLWLWRNKDNWAAFSMALVWLALSYIASINIAWWAGASFGNRYFLSLTPFFIFGLAAFIEYSKKWGLLVISLCVLWTVGLYLQFLNGTGFTSDSIVFPLSFLGAGQLPAFLQALNILPQLWVDWPWALAPTSLLFTFIVIFVISGRLVYGWLVRHNHPTTYQRLHQLLALGGLLIVGFVGLAGLRGEQTKADLTAQGFYQRPYEPILREVKEFAGKAGLVTRAMYHRSTGQPDRAIADLKLASEIWKRDSQPAPQRLYLGPRDQQTKAMTIQSELDLAYLGEIKLVGYEIKGLDAQSLTGELYWETLPVEKPESDALPIIRVFDRQGTLLGSTVLDFPFPARYAPPGSLLQDSFALEFATPVDDWLWLSVSLAESAELPLNGSGETQSNVIASLHLPPFPASSLPTSAAVSALIGKPFVNLAESYPAHTTIPLQMVWQLSQTVTAETHLEVSLFDTTQTMVAQKLYPLQNLQPEVHNQTYCFTLPETLSAGNYILVAQIAPPETGNLIDQNDQTVSALTWPLLIQAQDAAQSRPTICQLLEPRFARSYEPTTPQQAVGTALTPAITLAGYDFFVVPQAESLTANIILHWQAQANVSENYLVSVQLLDTAGQVVVDHTTLPQQGLRPTATWLQGEWILDEHVVQLPILAPGQYQLSVSLLDEQSGTPLILSSGQSHLVLQETQIP